MSLCMMDDCDGALEARGLCQKHYLRQWKYGDPAVVLAPNITHGLSVAQRLEFHSKLNESTGCMEWQSALDKKGYARLELSPSGEKVFAHRLSYTHHIGPIPDNMVIDHLCRNRKCINPEHLEPVTNRENILRGVGISANNAKKTHCVNNHPLSGDNLGINPNGARRCKACNRARVKAAYYRKAAR